MQTPQEEYACTHPENYYAAAMGPAFGASPGHDSTAARAKVQHHRP
jgi:hypothetical protein